MKLLLCVLSLAVVLARAEEDSVEQADSVEEPPVIERHPGADTQILFVKPVGGNRLVAGQDAQVLVGFINRAGEDLFLDTLDASFRLAMDYNSVIQNLSAIAYQRKVAPGQEASLFYQCHVDNVFSGIQVGLDLSLVYHDAQGKFYRQAVFNSTLSVEEPEVAFDVETFFLYVFLIACIVLGLVLLYQCLAGGRKMSMSRTETGTKGDGVDYNWIPSNVLKQGGSKPNSPRHRKNKTA